MNASLPLRALRRYPLSLYLSVLFSLLVFAAGTSVAWVSYLQGRSLALKAAHEAFLHIGRETKSSLREIMLPAQSFSELLALQPVAHAKTLAARLEALPLMARAFAGNAPVNAVYVGYDDGSFFLLRALRGQEQRGALGAPSTAAFLAESIEAAPGGKRQHDLLFFDPRLQLITRMPLADSHFDPRQRPWYRLAQEPGKRVLTEPYLFASTGEPGMTVAVRSTFASVIGIDATLQGLSEQLSALRTLPGMKIALFDAGRRLLARSDAGSEPAWVVGVNLALTTLDESGDAVFAAMQPYYPSQGGSHSETVEAGDARWQTVIFPVPTVRGPMFLGIAAPLEALLREAKALRDKGMATTAGVLLLALPLTGWTAHRVARSLRRIAHEAADIRAFRFDGPPVGPSVVREVDQLAQAMTMMRETIRHFLDIATSLAGETNFQRLLQRVVQETSSASGAAGGLIYLTNGDGHTLLPAALVWADGRALDEAIAAQDLEADSPAAEALRRGKTVTARLNGPAQGLEFLRSLFPDTEVTVVAIPLRDRDRETVGTLVLFSPVDEPMGEARLAFAEALSSTAAVAIETQRLLEARKALLDAFIRLVAGAIDAKSPYTGGHCQRVPALTMMLARAACEAQDGTFKDYCLSEEEWETLQIAAWLHDCGKVTTPEYVVDKATKLETLYDRLHEVRMRFEVLKRDAEIAYWKALAEGGDADAAAAALQATLRELDEDFTFVAHCNQGGESMEAGAVQRLQRIATRTWLRTLDDRIGISSEERARRERGPASVLPVPERLLADKQEHAIERPADEAMPEGNPWGFKLEVPALKYNRGELHNLSVERGTLTEEERYVINDHIVQTIMMLSQLPFPKHLAAVPAVAGGHHEKMDGSGYPRRLKREDMSIGARIIAIADIFEALTAVDRPYKQGHTLSEAIAIMERMKQEQHIDPDLFELFLQAGVFRQYAQRFLEPAQIDAVDMRHYLGDRAPTPA